MPKSSAFTSRGLILLKGRISRALRRARGAKTDRERQLLHRFDELKLQPIVAPPAPPLRGRKEDLAEHLSALRPEFEGLSELCFLHAELTVKIRRGLDSAESLETFFLLWRCEASFLSRHLNSRWLISALDSFADYGDAVQRPLALMQVAFFNVIKLAETEHLLLGSTPDRDALKRVGHADPQPLWDGMESYNVHKGDMLRNMFERMRREAKADRVLAVILEALLERAAVANTLVARMMVAGRHF